MWYALYSDVEWSDGVNFDWTFPYHQTRDPPRHLHLTQAAPKELAPHHSCT